MSFIAFAERVDVVRAHQDPSVVLRTQFPGVLGAAKAGAEWAWTLLYRSVAGKVLGYLRANGAKDPEDLLGEVFLQVARNIGTFEGDEDAFRSWVFMIAHHRIVDERRRWRRRPATSVAEVPDRIGGSSEDDAMSALSSAEVRETLDVLTPEQRDVVLLRVFADLSLEEVSAVVDRPVSAVKALQRRAYARLRKKLTAVSERERAQGRGRKKDGGDPYPDGSSRR